MQMVSRIHGFSIGVSSFCLHMSLTFPIASSLLKHIDVTTIAKWRDARYGCDAYARYARRPTKPNFLLYPIIACRRLLFIFSSVQSFSYFFTTYLVSSARVCRQRPPMNMRAAAAIPNCVGKLIVFFIDTPLLLLKYQYHTYHHPPLTNAIASTYNCINRRNTRDKIRGRRVLFVFISASSIPYTLFY